MSEQKLPALRRQFILYFFPLLLGYALVIYEAGWLMALALFLVMRSNNKMNTTYITAIILALPAEVRKKYMELRHGGEGS